MQTYTIPTQYQYTWLTMANTRVMQLAQRVADTADSGMRDMWLASYRETLDAIEATFGAEDKSRAVALFDTALLEARQQVAS